MRGVMSGQVMRKQVRRDPHRPHLAGINAEPTFSDRTTAPSRTAARVNLKRARSHRRGPSRNSGQPSSVLLRVLKNSQQRALRKDRRRGNRKHPPNVPRKEQHRSRRGRRHKLDLNRKRSHGLGLRLNRSLKQNLSARRLHPHSVPTAVVVRLPLRAHEAMLPWAHLAEADRRAANDANIEVSLE